MPQIPKEKVCRRNARKSSYKIRLNEKVVLIIDNKPEQGMEKLEWVLSTEKDDVGRRKYTVCTYTSPAEFLDVLKSKQGIYYDLALVDLSFGENCHYEGPDLIDAMKSKYVERPVLCCSAYSDNQYIWDGFLNHTKPNGVFTKTMCENEPGEALSIVENTIEHNPVRRE